MPEPMVMMRPPSPISCDAARIAVDHAVDIDRVLAVQRRGIAVGIVDRATGRDAGIVDENVEPAEMLCDVLHQLVDFGGGGLVGLEGLGFDAAGFQFLHHGLGLVGRGDVADRDIGAFARRGRGRWPRRCRASRR